MKTSFLALVLFLLSCNKNESFDTETGYRNAVISYTGSVAVDGCDWVVKIDDNYYHPDKLEDNFKQDGSNVSISYRVTTDKFHCGFTNAGMPVIKVLGLRK